MPADLTDFLLFSCVTAFTVGIVIAAAITWLLDRVEFKPFLSG
jgi:hypothetical protein